MSSQLLFGKSSKIGMKLYIYAFFSFLISLPLPLSIIKGRNTPGKPMREVSETQAHSHGFCVSHRAFYVWRLCKNCVYARACTYYMCHHVRMVVTSPLAAREEHSSNVHCHCHHHDDRTRGWGTGISMKWQPLVVPRSLAHSSSSVAIRNTNRTLSVNLTSNRTEESSSFCVLSGP